MPGPTTLFNTVTITGTMRTFKGDPIAGTVTFTPSGIVKDLVGKIVLFPVPITVGLVSGAFTVDLPATDDPDITGTFTYAYAESWSGGRTLAGVVVPVGTGPIDISVIAQSPSQPELDSTLYLDGGSL